ncbi:MAG: hypothetical protein V2J14_04350 [Erythrobacter sp.]|jgi:hypothetical protein|nr:hypothetical protein [Erythrobacter sp.]
MYRTTLHAKAVVVLMAFGGISTALADDGAPMASGADGITARPAARVPDQLIECTQDQGDGVSVVQLFLVSDGAVKRYARSMNMARDMCMPGQPDCALGWRGDRIAVYYRLPSGESSAATIDLQAMTISSMTLSAQGEETRVAGTCVSGPVPDGITIE